MKRWILFCLLAAVSSGAFAHASFNLRQSHQLFHIDEGVRRGDLSRSEARMLHAKIRLLRIEEREFLGDGKLDRRERRELRRDLNQLDRDIFRERFDYDRRPY